ncbi:DNA-binding proteins Bright/BRCAA1/RBP1 [Scheffersomyces xylosifermentans]|uniref:DNA-binding proteins Bright/BRCAA1/RBP1 n=1 Tax=Scheffersomyces xylosifermentans TaxID=1304137 RepID=UPI00315D754D
MALPRQGQAGSLAQIPNLQHPGASSGSTNSKGLTTTRVKIDPAESWYSSKNDDSSDEDSHNKTPSPKHRNFDFDVVGASTPLHILKGHGTNANDTVSFLSPMNKLNNLHLESELAEEGDESSDIENGNNLRLQMNMNMSMNGDIPPNDYYTDDDDDDDDVENEDDFSLGDKTITNDTDSDIEYHDDIDNDPNDNNANEEEDDSLIPLSSSSLNASFIGAPKFINRRKRSLTDSPSDMVITPKNQYNHLSLNYSSTTRKLIPTDDMSICNTSTSKISFSNSDSTPCPVQPKRKKLKFKRSSGNDGSTSITRTLRHKPILDLSHSKKTTILEADLLNGSVSSSLDDNYSESSESKNIEGDDEKIEDIEASTPSNVSSVPAANGSTPISQSTPSNSRASTPPHKYQEYGESINGYKFVKPVGKPHQFSYETPINNHRTTSAAKLRESYNRMDYDSATPISLEAPSSGKYEIVGEFPVTSAGMMDESDSEVHIGDKRINDPYLSTSRTSSPQNSRDFRREYFESFERDQVKLPLPPPYFDNQNELAYDHLLNLVRDGDVIGRFYELISEQEESMVDIIKSERIRWHPDRWVGKLNAQEEEDKNKEGVFVDLRLVDSLSQTLNSMLEEASL